MSIAKYTASVHDHTRILISVKHTKNVNKETLKVMLDKLSKHQKLVINDAGCAIRVCFEVDASPENSVWGSFQAHRQVLGLVFIADATTPMEAALVQDKFNRIKEEYSPGLYHSRCLIFGIDTTIRHSNNQDIFQFSSHEAWKSADYDIKQFVTSIFYDLESKRLKMAQEKNVRPPLIVAPFESADSENMGETDNKTFRKKCVGRHHKHLADVSLLAGQLPEALLCYHSALDILISTNDTMWIGSALEGLCVVSAQVFFPDLDPESSLWLKEKPPKQVLDPRNLVNKQISAPSLTELQKLCIPTIEDLVDRYKEAIIHYSRCKSLGIVEMEACIKATKVLTKGEKYLEASEFLQNAVYITLNLPETERIKRYSILADLYDGIGFQRKASFYKRVAAMQCVAPQLKEPNWELCNSLLLKSRSGYNLDLKDDCGDVSHRSHDHGWPNVRLRVLHELVFSSEKIGKHLLANKYMLFLLIHMLPHLSETEERDICSSLEIHAKKGQQSLADKSNIPIFTLYVLPVLKSLKPQSLADEAKPVKVGPKSNKSESVFIYTPSSYQSQISNPGETKFTWCVNAACTINICMYNPLRFCMLQVSNISLITDESSSKLDYQPLSFSIPPKSEKEVTLIATPSSSGFVKIIGYKICVLGTSSDCFFKNIIDLPTKEINIEVIQELPLLKCNHEIHETSSESNSTPLITVFGGEKHTVPFMLSNIGQCPVQDIKVLIKEKPNGDKLSFIFSDYEKDLPLVSNESLILPLNIEPSTKLLTSEDKLAPCTFTIQYAGNVKENTWWRSIDLSLNIKVDVCIKLNRILIQNDPNGSTDLCVVILETQNMLDQLIQLQYNCTSASNNGSDRKVSAIGPKGRKIVSVPMNKICSSAMTQNETVSIENFCVSVLKDLLNLTWKIQSEHINDQRVGSVYIESKLSRSSVCSFLKGPISCDVQFDNSIRGEEELIQADVGQPYDICFKFKNTTCSPWNFEAQLEVFQDQENGFIEWNMEQSVLCIGYTKEKLNIEPMGEGKFKSTVLFLRTGTYSLRISYAVTLLHDYIFKYSSPVKSILYYSPTVKIEV